MKFGKYFLVLLAAFFISSCDNESSHNKHQVGNVKIVNNEAVLIGDGVIRLKGVTVRVGMSALYVNGDDYGSVPGGARTVLRVHDNGNFEIFVNDEKVHKVRLTENFDTVIPVPVPDGAEKTGGQLLKIKFNFQSIQRNREKMKTDKYKILKIRLTESSQ